MRDQPFGASTARRRPYLIAAAMLGAVVVATLPVAPSQAETPGLIRTSEAIPGRYVVVYEDGVDRPIAATRGLERAQGFQARFTYGVAVKGFAASLAPGQVEAVQRDPRVALVAPDRPVQLTGSVPLASGEIAPTGVRRMRAATTSTTRKASSVNVAVIDTGVDLDHPDLNVEHGTNCLGTGLADDNHGHGTHVAGTIGAENDGAGVVGVAPGTQLFAVKVLDASGRGSMSSVICGIDWVTSTRTDESASNDIAVANMSLSGSGDPVETCGRTEDPEHLAICRSTAAGVSYVAAAGNRSWDFDFPSVPDVPAAYPQVLTVTAISDGDGVPGGVTKPSCEPKAADDKYASFSNFALTSQGASHTIAAPGQCIYSTTRGGGHGLMSGTSMASPHVAGAVALCLDEAGKDGPCSGMTPARIVDRMRAVAAARPSSYGFIGDPAHPVKRGFFGYLVWAGPEGDVEPPPPVDTTAPTISGISPSKDATAVATDATGATVSVTFSEEMDEESVEAAFSLEDEGGSSVQGQFSWSGTTMRFGADAPLEEGTSYTASIEDSATDLAGNPLQEGVQWSFTTITVHSPTPDAVEVLRGTLSTGGVPELEAQDKTYLKVASSWRGRSIWYGSFPGVSNSLRSLEIAYLGKNSRACTQTVSLYSWDLSAWVHIDTRSVGSKRVLVDDAIGGQNGAFVSGDSGPGELRMRVRCKASTPFVAKGDLMSITYGTP